MEVSDAAVGRAVGHLGVHLMFWFMDSGDERRAESAAKWRFVNPSAGKSVNDLPQDAPLFVARSGRDEMPYLNEALDRFVGKALARNLPITIVNHAEATHAFDVFHDSDASREIIRQWLAFLRFHLQR